MKVPLSTGRVKVGPANTRATVVKSGFLGITPEGQTVTLRSDVIAWLKRSGIIEDAATAVTILVDALGNAIVDASGNAIVLG